MKVFILVVVLWCCSLVLLEGSCHRNVMVQAVVLFVVLICWKAGKCVARGKKLMSLQDSFLLKVKLCVFWAVMHSMLWDTRVCMVLNRMFYIFVWAQHSLFLMGLRDRHVAN